MVGCEGVGRLCSMSGGCDLVSRGYFKITRKYNRGSDVLVVRG